MSLAISCNCVQPEPKRESVPGSSVDGRGAVQSEKQGAGWTDKVQDDVYIAVVLKHPDKIENILRIIAEIGVDGDDDLTSCFCKSSS
jgi:hypothetical protein